MLDAKSAFQPSIAALINRQNDRMPLFEVRCASLSDSRHPNATTAWIELLYAQTMRTRNRSQLLRVGYAFAGALLVAFSQWAGAELPDKQIRIIVPVAAGSSIDARARVIAHA